MEYTQRLAAASARTPSTTLLAWIAQTTRSTSRSYQRRDQTNKVKPGEGVMCYSQTLTDEVGELVLKDNYYQTQSLAVSGVRGEKLLDAQQQFIRHLNARAA